MKVQYKQQKMNSSSSSPSSRVKQTYSKDPADLVTINEKVLKVCPINEQVIKQ